MFDSVVLDVVIGLVFIYLLYSLLATIISEMISTWVGLRARVLRKAVEQMLNDHIAPSKDIGYRQHAWRRLQSFLLLERAEFGRSLAGRFYRQPSMKYLAPGNNRKDAFKNSKPSYITPQNFSNTIVHMLRSKGSGNTDMDRMRDCLELNSLHIQAETKRYLKYLLDDAGGDVQQFKKNLEQWFNDTMDRCTGWYKRKLQLILFVVGFVLAAFFNADTLRIVSVLSKDKGARDKLVQLSIQAADSTSSLSRALKQSKDTLAGEAALRNTYTQLYKDANSTNSVLGLGYTEQDKEFKCSGFLAFFCYKQLHPWRREFWGLVITALAISLGAPFWFDLLKRLVSIRGAGVNPNEKKTEQTETTETLPSENMTKEEVSVTQAATNAAGPISAVEALRDLLAGMAGLIVVRAGFIGKGTAKQAAIEVCVDSQAAVASATSKAGTTFQGIPVHYIVNTAAKPHLGGGDVIYNSSKVNGMGTLACYCSRIDSNKIYLLSCWHVLKGDRDWNHVSGPLTIDTNGRQNIAHIVDGCLAQSFDVGFAEMTNGAGLNNQGQNIRFNWREVSSNDAFSETAVSFRGSNSGLQQAIIYNHNVQQPIDYPDGQRTLTNLFSITTYTANGDFMAPSQAGDSGSLVVDSNGYPLGIVVGGDSAFTYVARFSAFMGGDNFYSEYKIII